MAVQKPQNSAKLPKNKVAKIRNDLSSLLPLGTLYFTNIPLLPIVSMDAPDGWLWMDSPPTGTNYRYKSLIDITKDYCLSPIFTDLSYLVERISVVCSYKPVKVNNRVKVTAVRVYCIPSDIEGGRYLQEVRDLQRRGKSKEWHEGKYKSIIKSLISVMDYSEAGWCCDDGKLTTGESMLVFNGVQDYKNFNVSDLGVGLYADHANLDYHVQRMLKNQSYSTSKSKLTTIDKLVKNHDLDLRLSDLYNSIPFTVESDSPYIFQLQTIKGLQTTLYPYQIESIAKMLHHETPLQSNHIPLPNFHTISKFNKTYHINTQNMKLSITAEYYIPPCGGILAENMGLGKTLICLALVCSTKNEGTAMIPEGLIQERFNDYEVRSLKEQCVRSINQEAVPWREYIDRLPETCVTLLKENPGFYFLYKDDLLTIERNSRMMNRDRLMITQEKVWLSHGTLVVVPDNLYTQWCQEVQKHIQPGYLEILYLPTPSTAIPTPRQLTQYDLLLLPQSVYVHQNHITSPLFKLHWKRLIIDEAHTLTAKLTRIVDLSSELHVERKWAVSGTPTQGLTNIHVNEGEGDVAVKKRFKAKDDLSRVGNLVCGYFKLQPWCYDRNLWNKSIVKPFVDDTVGGEASLKSLLSQLLVRHSIKDINTDLPLPPLYHTPIYLSPSRHNALSINLFTAVLAINAISSERTGQDYMFDRANVGQLRRLVSNLQRAGFYWTGFTISDVEGMSAVANICLERKNDHAEWYFNDKDRAVLKKCAEVCQEVLDDKAWCSVSRCHEMCYYVKGLDSAYSESFRLVDLENRNSVFGAPQLYKLQEFYFKNRFTQGEKLKERLTEENKKFWDWYWEDLRRRNKERVKKEKLDEDGNFTGNSRDDSPAIMKEIKWNQSHDIPKPSTNPSKSSLHSTLIGTSSSKLTYLTTQMLNNLKSSTKSLIFYENEDMAYHLSSTLDLLAIPYLLYSTSIPPLERQAHLTEFSESQQGLSLIMDLKLASHGLNIIAATKVYFISPVWRRGIEAQAIKRAHRIGQTSAVHVETLILKGSLEEEMLKLRVQGTCDREEEEEETRGAVADNEAIREYILKFGFIDTSKIDSADCSFDVDSREIVDVDLMKGDYGYELPEPKLRRTRDGNLQWSLPLFNKGAQVKISERSARSGALKLNKGIDDVNLKYDKGKGSVNNKVKIKMTVKDSLVEVQGTRVTIRVKKGFKDVDPLEGINKENVNVGILESPVKKKLRFG